MSAFSPGTSAYAGRKKAILKRSKGKRLILVRIGQYNITIKTKARSTRGLQTKVKKILHVGLTTYRKEKADGGEIVSVDVSLPSL